MQGKNKQPAEYYHTWLDITMQRFRTILIGSFVLFPLLSFAGRSLEKSVDSIYNSLDEKDRLRQLIWVKSIDIPRSIDSIVENRFGGIYVENPLPWSIPLPDGFVVALKMPTNFSFLNFDEQLPGLESLNTIRDVVLIKEYLQFIRSESMALGYDYMVLPDLAESNQHLGRIREIVLDFGQDFFIPESSLLFNPSPKRKSFLEDFQGHIAIVIDEDNLPDYGKIFKKPPKSLANYEDLIVDQLMKMYLPFRSDSLNIQQIIHQVWKKSIVAFRSKEILPIRQDTIAIWVDDENSTLKTELDLYYNTVLNLKYDNIPLGIPIIIDGRSEPLLATEYALAFQRYNPVIWISEANHITNLNATALLILPESNERHDHILSEMIYGSEGIDGLTTFPIPEYLAEYNTAPILNQLLLGYSNPKWAGMDEQVLDSLDVLAAEMIHNYASPGAQVLVAKSGKIVFQKAYGYLTYDSLIEVNLNTLYDLASLTKVTSTLLAIMNLADEGLIHLDSTLGFYIPEYAGSNKEHITIRHLLTHQAGLLSYIPFWKRSLRGDFFDIFYYKSKSAEEEDERSYGYRPDPIMKDSLESWLRSSRLVDNEDPGYLYSDLGFMILHQVVDRITGISIENYVNTYFYNPLALEYTHFNPLNQGFEIYEIAPTEYDYYFREEQVWGDVHDRNAAIYGGVAGHAGLFSNARNLAVILQMLLQDGRYGGNRYLSSAIINSFNTTQFDGNRRGLGWDKPGINNPNISDLASSVSFGHTGFTGTLVWVDPKYDLIFIFLSNRIFPDSNNKNLMRLDTRRRMHDIIYKSILASK